MQNVYIYIKFRLGKLLRANEHRYNFLVPTFHFKFNSLNGFATNALADPFNFALDKQSTSNSALLLNPSTYLIYCTLYNYYLF